MKGNLRLFIWMTLLTGLCYPLLITGIAHVTMRQQACGQFLTVQDRVVGALLIAQKFESERYFWPRPSAVDYNPLPSGGSNLGPTSQALKKVVMERREKLLQHDPNARSLPAELLYASGSGLDPDLSLAAAYFQLERVSKARGIASQQVKELIDRLAMPKTFGFMGEARINVLQLNLEMDKWTMDGNGR